MHGSQVPTTTWEQVTWLTGHHEGDRRHMTTSTASPQRQRRTVRTALILGGVGIAVALLVLGVAPVPVALGAIGLLLAWLTAPDTGHVGFGRRNVAIGAVVVAGCAVLALVPVLTRVLVALPGSPEMAFDGLLVMALVVIALPLALTRVDGPAPRFEVTRRTVLLAVTGLVVGAMCFTSGITFLGLVALVYLVVPVLIVSSLRHRRTGAGRRLSVNHLVFWTLVALTVLPGTYDVLRADFGDGYPIFIAGMIALPAIAILLPRRRSFAATNVLVAIGSVFLATQLAITYPPASDAVEIDSPLSGEWYVGHGGNAELVNYHHIAANQRDALDILKVRDNSTHAGAGHNLDDYYAFGEPVLSPGDVVITAATSTLSDQPVGTVDLDHPEGNVLVVDIGTGKYVVLAHLRQNSLQVSVGDRVHTGQPIAQVGNSGNTDEPHLHLQIQNRPELDASQFNPGLTTSAVLLRNTTVNNQFHAQTPLRRGDHFTSTVSG